MHLHKDNALLVFCDTLSCIQPRQRGGSGVAGVSVLQAVVVDEGQGRGNAKVETPVLAGRLSTLTVTLRAALKVSCDYLICATFQCALVCLC